MGGKSRQSHPSNNDDFTTSNNFTIGVDTLINSLQNFEDKPDQDIKQFIDQFDELAEAAKFPDDIKLVLIKTKIVGKAKEIVTNTPDLHKARDY